VPYYLRTVGFGHPDELWRIDDDEALQPHFSNALDGVGRFRREPGKTIWQTLAESTPWMTGPGTEPFHRIDLGARQYHPRIARPLKPGAEAFLCSPSATLEAPVVAMGRVQATTLMRRLDLICQTVHAAPETLGVYGHEIRNLLILAATEVETHWRGVLVANGCGVSKMTTVDYVRLLGPMKLDAYEVSFPNFPWLPAVRPFENWTSDAPTQSLGWYAAYNGVKHNREHEFERANLGNAFLAVSAVVVMLAAQFSRSIGLGGHSDLSAYFRFSKRPTWEPAELYIDFSEDGEEWSPAPLWPEG